MAIDRDTRRAAAWGVTFTAALAILIVLGSRGLEHFDAALVGYTFATLFATFAITYVALSAWIVVAGAWIAARRAL